jgi:hypothetical protein
MKDPELHALVAIIAKAQEDYAGLWEIPIVLRSVGVENPQGVAASLVRKLIHEGMLECVWGNPDPNPNAPLPTDDRERVLSEESFWREDLPFEGSTVWVWATPKGEQWVESLKLQGVIEHVPL